MFPLKPKQISLPKNKTRSVEAHTQNVRFGMGDNYGSGVKNPVGKMRSDSVGYRPVSKKQLGTAPRSVV